MEVSTIQARIAQQAKENPGRVWTALAHHLDAEWVTEAYARTRKDGAPGIDGKTMMEYCVTLPERRHELINEVKSGGYFAPPVKRVHIRKPGKDETRPIGIPTCEDRVLQRAALMLLEPIFEQDFLDCSYGFRQGRSAHQALDTIWKAIMEMGGGWVLDVDVRKYFDSLNHAHLREFLDLRVRDGVIRRLIDKWLKAGVMEDGLFSRTTQGTPQGGVISPLLSNLYLHHVLDLWFQDEVIPRLAGKAKLIRDADDFVIIFQREDDARRVMEVLPKRFARFDLQIHPDKTKLVPFLPPPRSAGEQDKPQTFDFLGFTHHWGKSSKGSWAVQRRTMCSRFARALASIDEWCRDSRHLPIHQQHQTLSRKLTGHYAYYGIIGNYRRLAEFGYQVRHRWKHWLDRRDRTQGFGWARMNAFLAAYPLPPPRMIAAAKP